MIPLVPFALSQSSQLQCAGKSTLGKMLVSIIVTRHRFSSYGVLLRELYTMKHKVLRNFWKRIAEGGVAAVCASELVMHTWLGSSQIPVCKLPSRNSTLIRREH